MEGRAKGTRGFAHAVFAVCLASSLIPHLSSLAWAAHPFITDDTGTQGAGGWQLELLGDWNRHDSTAPTGAGAVQQRRRVTLLTPVLTYGLSDRVDLAVGAAHIDQRITENGIVTESAAGVSDTALELKWRFWESNGFSMALKPALLLPTGDEKRGLGTGALSYGLNTIVTFEAEPWTLLGNLAYARLRFKRPQDALDERQDLFRLSGGVAYALRKGLKLVGEAGARTNESRDDPFLPGRNGHYAMVGFVYSPSDKIDLDAGFRKSVNHAELDRAFLLGATFRW